MKKHFLTSIIALICAVNSPTIFAQNKNQITIGSIDSLYSKTLDEQRKIWVHIPRSAQNQSQKKYPVLYVLDGPGHFHSITGIIQRLSPEIYPEMIVVGIPNTDRYRDLTPSHTGDSINPSGGGEKFTTFLEKELIPFVDGKYPTVSYRTLIGHSLGGLMVINTLVHHPEIFTNYLAIDPSLWWDDQKVLKETVSVLKKDTFKNKSLYVSIANTMPKGMDITNVVKDTTQTTDHIRSILQFTKEASANSKNGLNFAWKYYKDDTHGSVPLISEYDGLRFMFSWFKFDDWNEFYEDTSTATAQELLDLLAAHYKKVSDKMGYKMLPDEQRINGLGYRFMGNEAYEKSYAFFNLNIQNYPKSANVYDSMGDYYMSQSNTTKAKEFFTKSMELGGVNGTKEKLEELQTGK